MEATDHVVEDEAPKYPRNIVNPRSRRHSSETGEEDWDVDVSPDGQREATSKEVEGDGCKDTDGEEPKDSGVSARTRVSNY